MLAGRVDSGCAKHSSSRGRTRRCTSRAQPCRPGKTPACSLSSALCPLSTLLLLLLLLLLLRCWLCRAVQSLGQPVQFRQSSGWGGPRS